MNFNNLFNTEVVDTVEASSFQKFDCFAVVAAVLLTSVVAFSVELLAEINFYKC